MSSSPRRIPPTDVRADEEIGHYTDKSIPTRLILPFEREKKEK